MSKSNEIPGGSPSIRQIGAKNGLYVRVRRIFDGGLEFDGQDINPNRFGDSD